ncbi:hypothetical protein [Nitrobacter sp.]|jgi:hypothetical protein
MSISERNPITSGLTGFSRGRQKHARRQADSLMEDFGSMIAVN